MQTPPLLSSSLRYFDKILLSGAALWLAVTGIGFALTPAGLDTDLDTDLAAIEAYVAEVELPPADSPAWAETLADHLEPARVPAVDPFPDWLAHKRPMEIAEAGPPPPEITYEHTPPRITLADAGERGRVLVRWQPAEFSDLLESHGHEVWRSADDDEWALIHTAEWGTNEFVDATVAAKTRYRYRVVSRIGLDPELAIDRRLPPLSKKQARAQSQDSDVAETPLDLFVMVSTVSIYDPVTQPDKVNSAYVWVYRWDEDKADWARKGYQVQVGDPIGKGAFATGATLRDVRIDRRAHGKIRGHEERLQVIEFGIEGGPSETANDKDRPE